MAFVLTPRFASGYQAPQCNPFGFCAPVSRPQYAYRVSRPRPQRPQYSSFSHFFNQVDELLGEIDRESQRQAQLEAQREAHRQRQQRKRALRARFAIDPTEQGWQVNGEFQGFSQENITIEVTDDNTLKITGNTHWQAEKEAQSEQLPQPSLTEQETEKKESNDTMDSVTVHEPDFENVTDADTATISAATPDSDSESHKSYQATVEDDFEDLGAETSSLISSPSRPSSPVAATEPKGKEKAADEPATIDTANSQEHQSDGATVVDQQQLQQEEKVHGSFERTFRFPERIDASKVSASFKDGVLSVTIPKAHAQQVRRIAIL